MKIEDLEIIKTLGDGSFGTVLQVLEKKTNQPYALKIIDKRFVLKTYKSLLPVLKEKEILRFTKNCKQVVSMRASFQDSRNIYILTEKVEGRDLESFVDEYGSLES